MANVGQHQQRTYRPKRPHLKIQATETTPIQSSAFLVRLRMHFCRCRQTVEKLVRQTHVTKVGHQDKRPPATTRCKWRSLKLWRSWPSEPPTAMWWFYLVGGLLSISAMACHHDGSSWNVANKVHLSRCAKLGFVVYSVGYYLVIFFSGRSYRKNIQTERRTPASASTRLRPARSRARNGQN